MIKPDRRQTVRAALRESEERFRLMIQAVKDYSIFMVDPQGRVVNWNEGEHRIKGSDASSAVLPQCCLPLLEPAGAVRGQDPGLGLFIHSELCFRQYILPASISTFVEKGR